MSQPQEAVKPVLSSYTIRAILLGIVTLVGSFGIKWTLNSSQIANVAEGVLALISLLSMAAAGYGRLRARQPLGDPQTNTPAASPAPLVVTPGQVLDPRVDTEAEPGQKVHLVKDGSVEPPASGRGLGVVLLLFFGFIGSGCGSQLTPLQRVDLSRRSYVAALNTLSPLIEAHVLPTATVEGLYQARLTVAKGLDDAEALAVQGKNLDANFALNQISTALDKLLAAAAGVRKGSTTKPSQGDIWTPLRLRPFLPVPSVERWRLPTSTSGPTVASSLRIRIATC